MSWLCDTSELVSSSWLTSAYAGHGIRGDQVPSSGVSGAPPLYNDITLPADAAAEVRALVLTQPSAGTLEVDEDSSFYFYGAPDGTYTWTYAHYKDGAFVANNTVTITVGASTVTLVLANAAHAHLADSVGLSTAGSASLVVADAAHPQIAESLTISVQWLLAIADALHSHTADNLLWYVTVSLDVTDAAHGHTAESPVLFSSTLSYPTAAEIAAAIIAAAQVTPIHANVKQMNDAVVVGDGSPTNKWRGTGV